MKTKQLLRMPDVIVQVALSKSQIYKLIKEGSFPKPIKVGSRVSAWVSEDIGRWIDQTINAANDAEVER